MSSAPHVCVHEQRHDPHSVTVRIVGEIHVSTAPRLGADLSPIVDRPGMRVVLDLTEVEFIDSTGLSVLLDALRRTVRGGGGLAVVCTNPTVLRLFEITHLHETFAIRASEAEARAALQPAGGSTSGMP